MFSPYTETRQQFINRLILNTRQAKARRKNPLRVDPTRTGLLRRKFEAEIRKRFAALRSAIYRLVVVDDAFGLRVGPLDVFNATPTTNAQRWRFLTDDQKLNAFKTWLAGEVAKGVLAADPSGGSDEYWTSKFIQSAYKSAVMKAYEAVFKDEAGRPVGYGQGTRGEFLRSSFSQPERTSKLALLSTRTYDQLKGVTDKMGQDMSRVLTEGLAGGWNPRDIARTMTREIEGLERKRALVIARTEIIYAHSEGQLDSFEDLGVEEVGIMAEFSTAEDEEVCPVCEALSQTIFKVSEAHGLIPRHPNCRCTWIPYLGEITREPGQKHAKSRIQAAIKASVQAERPKKDLKTAMERSTWTGADLVVSKDRSP